MSSKPLVVATTSFPIAGDGSEAAGSFVSDLVEELARQIPVRVVAPGPEQCRESWSGGAEVWRYAAPNKPLSTLKPWRPQDMAWAVRVLRGGQRACHEAVQGAGHVLALWGLPSGAWARCAARAAGIDYSVWLLGSDVWSLGKIPGVRQQLARVIRGARHAWADGYQLAADAERIANVPVSFLPTTRRILTVNPPPPRHEPPYRLLFLGRWHPNKGVDLLLDALALLEDDDWQRIETVEIQGGGPLDAFVRQHVASLRAAGRPVELGRFLPKPDAEAAIVRADWVLIPSRIESIPVVFSDAVKLRRPVVGMPVGDLPKLQGRMTFGVVARRIDALAFRDALRTALRISPSACGAAVQSHADEFDLAHIAAQIGRKVQADG